MTENDIITEIPVFFTTDDTYIPYLDVAISSLIENASKAYNYRIIVLNTGLCEENVKKVKAREASGFKIDFIDISERLKSIKSRFKNVYHFSIVTYYRLFIASLFPEYDKIVYIDCDLVVLGDISEFYRTELGENIMGAVPDPFVKNTAEFSLYAKNAICVEPAEYINAGVLLLNLAEFRKNDIENKFINLISTYDFDLVDPDQAYLNYLCRGKIHFFKNGWNKIPSPLPCEGKKNIVHYALYKKPWQYDDVADGEYFWHYAKLSPFYGLICQRKSNFSEADRADNDATGTLILQHALKIAKSENTFAKKLCEN